MSCCSQSRLCYREGTGDSSFEKQQETRISHRFCRIKFLRFFFPPSFFAKGLHLTGNKVLFAVRSCIHPIMCCVQRISIRAHFSRFRRPICPRSILCVKTNIFLQLVFLKVVLKRLHRSYKERLLSSQAHHVELQLILTRLVAQHHICISSDSGACIFVQCQLHNALIKK